MRFAPSDMNLLLFNLATDANDTSLGFTTDWLTVLARYFSQIHVITMRRGSSQLPNNVAVYSVGKELGWSRARRTLAFYQILYRILRRHRVDVCFAHMIPIFAVLAGPVLKAKRIPIILWHAHPSVTATLRVAHWFSNKVVTSIDFAYPYKQDKVVTIGQGIDTNFFSPRTEQIDLPVPGLIVAVGRISKVKQLDVLLDVAQLLNGRDSGSIRIVLIGGPSTAADIDYLRKLEDGVRSRNLVGVVHFAGAKQRYELLDWYRNATALINLTGRGCGDKVVFEAMSCGTPVVVANEGFRTTLGLYADRFVLHDVYPETIASAIESTCTLSKEERAEVGRYIRAQVTTLHSLEGLAGKLHSVCKDLLIKLHDSKV
jgi:glycosyltransferase involved in cell wall biosynthesis